MFPVPVNGPKNTPGLDPKINVIKMTSVAAVRLWRCTGRRWGNSLGGRIKEVAAGRGGEEKVAGKSRVSTLGTAAANFTSPLVNLHLTFSALTSAAKCMCM